MTTATEKMGELGGTL